jgi:hypothetical protein
MKKLSIFLLIATMPHAVITADATAFVVAFLFFSHTCGKDVVKYWEELLSK